MSRDSSYVIVTPARDEEAYLETTIASVAAQTVLPAEWVIVDDGSQDATGQIAGEASRHHSWISVVHRPNRGFRKPGGGVVEAFDAGLQELEAEGWDFLVKLDGDLALPPDYFARCLKRFHDNPKLGVGGGVIHHQIDGRRVLEEHPLFHVRGATKIYRRACWEDIAPLFAGPGWDTLDEVKANMLGWQTYSFPEIPIVHQRVTGMANGYWGNSVKNGRAGYLIGYHPLYQLAKAAAWLRRWPYGLQSLGLLWGFFGGYLQQLPQIPDEPLIRYLRDQQLRALLGRESIWR
jgi:glycosyltransferase involved in cell wall biosynthesis